MKKRILLFCTLLLCTGLYSQHYFIKDPTQRKRVERFVLTDFNGQQHSLTSLSGKTAERDILLFSFFKTDCMPCVKELDSLLALKNTYKSANLKIIYVGLQSKSKLNRALKKGDDAFDQASMKKLLDNFTVLIDANKKLYAELTGETDMVRIPANIIVDKNRKGAFSKIGFKETDDFDTFISAAFDTLLTEKVIDRKNRGNEITAVFSSCESGAKYTLNMRHALYQDLRDIYGELLLCATGDFNFVEGTLEKETLIFESMNDLGYNALVPGDQEFVNGSDSITANNLPFVACNLFYNKKQMFAGSLIIERGGTKIGITGVIDPDAFTYIANKKITIGNEYKSILTKESAKLNNAGVTTHIILCHGGQKFVEDLAREFTDVLVIAAGHTQEDFITNSPETPLLLQPGAGGRFVYLVRFDVKNKKLIESRKIPVKELLLK